MRTLRRRIALALLPCLAACFAGPHQLRRSVDDWDQKTYVNSPWWNASLWIIPVLPVSYITAIVFDFTITDPWAFWFEDAWDGSGTGFKHLDVQYTDGSMSSLWRERGSWTKIDR